ncbi:MAG: sugar ABC transporter permease [Clostridia bacterium]|nr:sugar ABC transporter permease [Clostridia bacterium]MBQ9251244.1 sugar ABC transporter permease [Clostridia bacterium]
MSPRTRRQILVGILFILPSFVLMMTFNVVPIFLSLFYSFTKYNMASPPQWIGLDNYARLFSNRVLTESLSNTVRYVLITVPAQTVLSLLLAVFIAEHMKNRYGSLMRSVIFIPVIVSLIASATVWNIMYQPKGGLINQVIEAFGGKAVNFLGKKASALPSVAVVAIWKNTGYYMVIYYAGVMNVSADVREAAIVDGATPLKRFWYITLPILKPITYMIVTLGIIGSFQVFDLVYKMTGGGPGRATYTVAYVIYTFAFQDKNFGYASAVAICLLIVILLIHLVQTTLFKEKDA